MSDRIFQKVSARDTELLSDKLLNPDHDPEHDLYRDLDHGSNQNRGPDTQIWLNIMFTYNDKCVCTRVGPDPDLPFDLFFAQKS